MPQRHTKKEAVASRARKLAKVAKRQRKLARRSLDVGLDDVAYEDAALDLAQPLAASPPQEPDYEVYYSGADHSDDPEAVLSSTSCSSSSPNVGDDGKDLVYTDVKFSVGDDLKHPLVSKDGKPAHVDIDGKHSDAVHSVHDVSSGSSMDLVRPFIVFVW